MRFIPLALALALIACGASRRDAVGTYYWFMNGKRPTSNTFKSMEGPIAVLELTQDNKWSLGIIMMERPFTGTWSVNGSRVALKMTDPRPISGEFEIIDGGLKPVSGDIAKMFKNQTLWTMPKEWKESAEEQSTRDGTVKQARDISKAILMYAGDSMDVLPKTQSELEEKLLPYLVDRSLFKGFNYTFKGGKLPPESMRDKAELGYVIGVGGRAVILANGGAEWRKM